MRANDLVELDRRHLIHPVTSWRQHEQRGVTVIESASGAYVTDNHGKTLLDGFAGLWCVNAGYGHAGIVEAAADQMRRLPYATGYFGFGSEPAIRLAARLAELAPGDLNHVYFTLGGSDAVDSAVRFIQNFNRANGRPEKRHMIALGRGYHGSTSTGSGLTALPVFHQNFDGPAAWQHHIPSPYPYRNPAGSSAAAVIASSVAALRAKVEELGGSGQVAAFFCEPIQGSGGVIVPPDGWLRAMRETCRELDILFVADEVITGFGRTGPMFGCEYEDVAPDIMTVAKGLTSGYVPMGATILSERVYRAIADANPAGAPIGHGFTYSAHPVSAAVGLEVLKLYTDGGLLENGRRVGQYFMDRLGEFGGHPLVGEVRGRGLLAAVELVVDKEKRTKPDPALGLGAKLFEHGYDNGLIFRAFSDDVIGFAPPLCFSNDDVDRLVDRLRRTLDWALEMKYVRDAMPG